MTAWFVYSELSFVGIRKEDLKINCTNLIYSYNHVIATVENAKNEESSWKVVWCTENLAYGG